MKLFEEIQRSNLEEIITFRLLIFEPTKKSSSRFFIKKDLELYGHENIIDNLVENYNNYQILLDQCPIGKKIGIGGEWFSLSDEYNEKIREIPISHINCPTCFKQYFFEQLEKIKKSKKNHDCKQEIKKLFYQQRN